MSQHESDNKAAGEGAGTQSWASRMRYMRCLDFLPRQWDSLEAFAFLNDIFVFETRSPSPAMTGLL